MSRCSASSNNWSGPGTNGRRAIRTGVPPRASNAGWPTARPARSSRRRPLADLEAVEATIWSLLEPYRGELEDATIYGLPSLRWPGAKAHDYFASVKRGKSYVSLYLLVADTYPDALEGTPSALLKRRTGKAAFNFSTLDAEMADDLRALLHRLYARYRAEHAVPPG